MTLVRDLISQKTISRNEGSLSSAGETTANRRLINYKRATYQGVVKNIGTDVAVRLEGTTNGIDYDNLDLEDVDLIITSNGSFTIGYNGIVPVLRIRLKLVSINGGTPTIDNIASQFDKK